MDCDGFKYWLLAYGPLYSGFSARRYQSVLRNSQPYRPIHGTSSALALKMIRTIHGHNTSFPAKHHLMLPVSFEVALCFVRLG